MICIAQTEWNLLFIDMKIGKNMMHTKKEMEQNGYRCMDFLPPLSEESMQMQAVRYRKPINAF